MDQHDPSRRSYAQQTSDSTAQQPQSSSARQNIAGQQGYVLATPQFVPSQPGGFQQRQDGVVPSPIAGNQERAGPVNPPLYYAQGYSYGTTSTPQPLGSQLRPDVKQEASQQQVYGPYTYDVDRGAPQQTQQQMFVSVPSGQSATGETVPSQFETPHAAQYYPGNQQLTSSVPVGQYATQQYPQQFAAPSFTASAPLMTVQTIPSNVMNVPTQPSFAQSQPAFAQPQPVQQPISYVQAEPPRVPSFPRPSIESTTHNVSQYQLLVRTLFTAVRARNLIDVPQHLRDLTAYVATNLIALGLAHDSDSRNDESNLKFWEEFNRTWLTSLQCSFDLTQAVINGELAPDEVFAFNKQTLESLAEHLVSLGDRVEKHGLVDYQMGVAEDEIMEMIFRCIAQLEAIERAAEEQQAEAGAPEPAEAEA